MNSLESEGRIIPYCPIEQLLSEWEQNFRSHDPSDGPSTIDVRVTSVRKPLSHAFIYIQRHPPVLDARGDIGESEVDDGEDGLA